MAAGRRCWCWRPWRCRERRVGGAGGPPARAGYTRALVGGEVVPLDPLPRLRRGTKRSRSSWTASAGMPANAPPGRGLRAGVPARRGPARAGGGRRARPRRSERWACSPCGAAAVRAGARAVLVQQPAGGLPRVQGFRRRAVRSPRADRARRARRCARARSRRGPARGARRLAALQKLAAERGVPIDVPWRDLSAEHRKLVLEGDRRSAARSRSWSGCSRSPTRPATASSSGATRRRGVPRLRRHAPAPRGAGRAARRPGHRRGRRAAGRPAARVRGGARARRTRAPSPASRSTRCSRGCASSSASTSAT